MPRFNLSLRFYDQDAIYDYIDGTRNSLTANEHIGTRMARHLGFTERRDGLFAVRPPRTRENVIKLALLGAAITVAKHRDRSIPERRRRELMDNVRWGSTPQGIEFWADRFDGRPGAHFNQADFGEQIGNLLLDIEAQAEGRVYVYFNGMQRRIADLTGDVSTPNPVPAATASPTSEPEAPRAAFQLTTAAGGGFNLEQFVRVEQGLRPTRRIFPTAWEAYLGHTQDDIPRWKLRILAVMAAVAQTRAGASLDMNVFSAVDRYLTWSCWTGLRWSDIRRGTMAGEKVRLINRHGLPGLRRQIFARNGSGDIFVPPNFTIEATAPEEGRLTGAAPTIQSLQSCCAGSVIASWGHGDPDRRNQSMTKADVRRFHTGQLAAGAARRFQLAVLHDNQVERLTPAFLEELGWERVKDLTNNSGRQCLSLWVRNPS
jgi:hypothetical protein